LSWTLFELTQHPYIQTKLRAEILAIEQDVRARGGTEFTAADFDNMPYTIAVMKVRFLHANSFASLIDVQETLRFHPVA
jgi:cytochrome P450